MRSALLEGIFVRCGLSVADTRNMNNDPISGKDVLYITARETLVADQLPFLWWIWLRTPRPNITIAPDKPQAT
jgi:hypothetical protein